MTRCLADAGFGVLEATDGRTGLHAACERQPDAIILDILLPEMGGKELIRSLRSRVSTAGIPAIVLTSQAREGDRVEAFEAGADDYITTPFDPRELVLRVRAILRRLHAMDGDRVSFGPFEFDQSCFEIRMDGRPLKLGNIEARIMALLVRGRGDVVSRSFLLRCAWGTECAPDQRAENRALDTHIARLRRKLEMRSKCVETVRGMGHRLRLEHCQ